MLQCQREYRWAEGQYDRFLAAEGCTSRPELAGTCRCDCHSSAMRYGRLVKVTTVSGSDRTEVVYVLAEADAAAAESHQGSNRRA